MILCVLNPEKIWHQQLLHFPTSPVYCSHFTLGNPKSHFSTVSFIHACTSVLGLFSLSQKKTNCYSLTHHTWKNVTALPCKMHNFFIWWRYVAFLQTLVALKKAGCGLALVSLKRTGCGMWQMSGKQRYNKCSKWPLSARIWKIKRWAFLALYKSFTYLLNYKAMMEHKL